VVGPLLAGAGIATIGARASLVISAAALVAGTLTFAAVSRATPVETHETGPAPIRLPGVRTLILATALADIALGGADVAIPAFADAHGSPGLAGVLLAAFCVGAVAGALAYGSRPWPLDPPRQLAVISLVGAATMALLALPSSPVVLAVLLVLAGAPGAGQWAASSLALDRASGGRGGAEAFTWLGAANGVGIAIGSVAGGAAAEHWSPGAAFLLVAVGPLLAAVLVTARARTL
jgi:predicted MFS family arabinose efflux permease